MLWWCAPTGYLLPNQTEDIKFDCLVEEILTYLIKQFTNVLISLTGTISFFAQVCFKGIQSVRRK